MDRNLFNDKLVLATVLALYKTYDKQALKLIKYDNYLHKLCHCTRNGL